MRAVAREIRQWTSLELPHAPPPSRILGRSPSPATAGWGSSRAVALTLVYRRPKVGVGKKKRKKNVGMRRSRLL